MCTYSPRWVPFSVKASRKQILQQLKLWDPLLAFEACGVSLLVRFSPLMLHTLGFVQMLLWNGFLQLQLSAKPSSLQFSGIWAVG